MGEQGHDSVIWDVPHERNPNFVGRDGLLAELRQRLAGGDRVQAVHGLGGVGKTEAVLEYAYRHRADYSLVCWVPANSEALVLQAYERLAHRMGHRLSPRAAPAVAVELLQGMLAGHRTLLIYDAATDAATLGPLLPANPGGHVLITSRSPTWGSVAHARPVRVLDRAASVAFLRNSTGIAGPDDDDAGRLALSLGDLPLALDQAAAVIRQDGLSFGDYLRRFEGQWAVMLGEGVKPVDYPRSVAMTWSLAFAALEEASPDAADLLKLAAFLNSDHVERRLLRDGAEHVGPGLRVLVEEAEVWTAALSALLNYSLIEADEALASFGMHRLVGAVTRDRMTAGPERFWCGTALAVVAGLFRYDSGDVSTWDACGRLLPHVIEVTAHAERLGVAAEQTARLLNDAGRYLLKRAQYADAKRLLERALALSVGTFGPDHPKVAVTANNLGRVHDHLGETDRAIECFAKSIAIDTATYGESHPHVAEVINNYGICMQKKGDLQMARQQFQWAAEIYESHHGPMHPKLASILNNLAYAAKGLNDRADARFQLLRAITIAEATVGRHHPTTARILFNTADVLIADGQLAAARQHLERALSIDQAALGPRHPDVRADCEALSAVLASLGEPRLAAEFRSRADDIRRLERPRPARMAPADSLAG